VTKRAPSPPPLSLILSFFLARRKSFSSGNSTVREMKFMNAAVRVPVPREGKRGVSETLKLAASGEDFIGKVKEREREREGRSQG